MRRRPLSVPDSPGKLEISFSIADLTSTVVIKSRLREFFEHLGFSESLIRTVLEAFSQWSCGRDFSPEQRKVLIHSFLKDGLDNYLKKCGHSDQEIDLTLSGLDDIAERFEGSSK